MYCVFAAAAACSSPAATPSCPTISQSCPTPPPSWSKDVQPLVQNYCVMCHSPGGVGEPMADLTTYAGVYKARAEVQQQVYQCLMPNQDASPPAPTLTSAQRETIVSWVACNAPNN
jgi:hypothetical protein